MRKHFSSLRAVLLVSFLLTTLAVFALIALAVAIGARMHFIADRAAPLVTIAIVSIIFCVLSSVIIAITISKVLRPIKKLTIATKEVAKGNFDVQLDSDDNTELGELTSSFNTMVRELGSIEALRNDFISNVSHEFKTPLASMQGYATLLQDDDLTVDERRGA